MKKTVGLFAYGEMGGSILRALIKEFTVRWVILPSPKIQSDTEKSTNEFARKHKVRIVYASLARELSDHIRTNKPDLVVVSSFNKIIPSEIIKMTKFINVHLGDLPRFRGRANVNWAIINDRNSIGVTMHEVVSDLDAGNIYDQKMIAILKTDTVKTVYDKINTYLSQNVCRIVDKVLDGYQGVAQKGKATYCCTRLPEDGLIDWNKTSQELYNFVRALTKPYPGAYTYFEGKKVIIWSAELPKKPKIYEGRVPGRIASIIPNYGVEVLTGDSAIIIRNVFLQNKECNASEVIKSVKKTLGINWVEIYEKLYGH